MVTPDEYRKAANRNRSEDHRSVAEQGFARKCRDYRGDDAKCRQDKDIDLGMTKEPENMLKQNWVTAAHRIEKMCTEMPIKQKHGHRPREHRHDDEQKICRYQPGPSEHEHFHHRHAWRTHIGNRGNYVQ